MILETISHFVLTFSLAQTTTGTSLQGDYREGQMDELHSFVVHTLHIGAPTPEMQTVDDTMKSFLGAGIFWNSQYRPLSLR